MMADSLVLNALFVDGEDGLNNAQCLCESIDMCDQDTLAKALVYLYENEDSTMTLLERTISTEVLATDAVALLFRSNSMASKMMLAYARLVGLEYLRDTLKPAVDSMFDCGSFEVDPTKVAEGEDIEQNEQKLQERLKHFLSCILSSVATCPKALRNLCKTIYDSISKKFPGYENIGVGGFYFLRFVCPAIVTPTVYGILPTMPKKEIHRGLVFVAKVLQNLANDVKFGGKEQFLVFCNDWLVESKDAIRNFLRDLASPTDSDKPAPTPISQEWMIKSSQDLRKIVTNNIDKLSEKMKDESKVNKIKIEISDTKSEVSDKTSTVSEKSKEDQYMLNTEIKWDSPPRNPLIVVEELLLASHWVCESFALGTDDDRVYQWDRRDNSIDYNEFALDTAELQKITLVGLNREQMITFFINLYNLMVFHVHAVHGVIKPKHKKIFFKKYKYDIGGVQFSLDDIYHGVLRGNPEFCQWKKTDTHMPYAIEKPDPRVHFALSQGFVVSSPRVRLYRADTLDQDLKLVTLEYIRAQVECQEDKKKLMLPKVFETYLRDFGLIKTDVFRWLGAYLDEKSASTVSQFVASGDYQLMYKDIDWAQAPRAYISIDLKVECEQRKHPRTGLPDEKIVLEPCGDPVGGLMLCTEFPDEAWVLNTETIWPDTARPAVGLSASLLKYLLKISKRYLWDWRTIAASSEFSVFSKFTTELQQVKLKMLSRDEKICFFVNIYHVLLIHIYAAFGAPKTNPKKLLSSYRYRIGDHSYSLDEIYHGILQGNQKNKYFKKKDVRCDFAIPDPDPRVHFVMSLCMKYSPPIVILRPETLDQQLTTAVKEYLAETCEIVASKKRCRLPYIFKEYKSDFGDHTADIMEWVLKFVENKTEGVALKSFKIETSEPIWVPSPTAAKF